LQWSCLATGTGWWSELAEGVRESKTWKWHGEWSAKQNVDLPIWLETQNAIKVATNQEYFHSKETFSIDVSIFCCCFFIEYWTHWTRIAVKSEEWKRKGRGRGEENGWSFAAVVTLFYCWLCL